MPSADADDLLLSGRGGLRLPQSRKIGRFLVRSRGASRDHLISKVNAVIASAPDPVKRAKDLLLVELKNQNRIGDILLGHKVANHVDPPIHRDKHRCCVDLLRAGKDLFLRMIKKVLYIGIYCARIVIQRVCGVLRGICEAENRAAEVVVIAVLRRKELLGRTV